MKVIEAQHDEESGIDVAPLIDILFTLIIFLLLTTTFEEEEKAPEIQLPRLGGASLASKSLLRPTLTFLSSIFLSASLHSCRIRRSWCAWPLSTT